MADWQPIETAPADETEVLILWDGAEVTSGSRYEGGFIDYWCNWLDPQPTHWQPLPAPPEGD